MSGDRERDERMIDLDLRYPPDDDVEVEIVSFGDEGESADAEPAKVGAPTGAPPDALQAKLAEAEELNLRLRAEFENFRKRLEREREERERRALASAFLDLLPVVDNLERAIHAKGGLDDLRKGVELVARQLVDTLRRFGLAEIPAVGRPFDPRVHEAVARVESAEHAEPTVIAELQRGYWLNERLLRPAMVKVAVPADQLEASSPRDPSADTPSSGSTGESA